MKAAAQIQSYMTKRINANQRKALALKIIEHKNPISLIANEHQVSRKFLYEQKSKATDAINNAFAKPEKNDDVLFWMPVTKEWLTQWILCLLLNCKSSFRGVIKTFEDMFDLQTSIGTVENVAKNAVMKAQAINAKQTLNHVRIGANDELFHQNKPVLAGVDTVSLYCYLLAQEQSRDSDTWGVHLLDLEKQGFNPERIIADDGDGLRAGQKIACPHIPCDGDNFHLSKMLIECRRFFRNRLKSAVTYCDSMESKFAKAKQKKKGNKFSRKFFLAKQHANKIHYLSQSIDTLVSWMEHDVLSKAGPCLETRMELYDFIVDEFRKLEKQHPHRIKSVRTTLKNQRDSQLAFVEVLHEKFQEIAEQYQCSLYTVWQLCELQRYSKNCPQYYEKANPLRRRLHQQFYFLEQAVIEAMNNTERTSSAVENFNSRISPYLFLRKEVGHGYLDLLRFYLNHAPFMRSAKTERVGKSPAEILNGKSHPHWLEMLGFEKFKRAA